MDAIIQAEIGDQLGDESLVEYVAGMLADAPDEAESSEAISAFLGSVGLEDDDAAAAASKLFAALRAAGFGATGATGGGGGGSAGEGASPVEITRKLEKSVKIAEQDETLAFGMRDDGNYSSKGGKVRAPTLSHHKPCSPFDSPQSTDTLLLMRCFGLPRCQVLVGMRDAGGPAEATSQKAARKKAQELRRAEQARRESEDAAAFEQALLHEMSLAASSGGGEASGFGDGDIGEDDDLSEGGPGAGGRDVHFRNFELENKRGAGQLLVRAFEPRLRAVSCRGAFLAAAFAHASQHYRAPSWPIRPLVGRGGLDPRGGAPLRPAGPER